MKAKVLSEEVKIPEKISLDLDNGFVIVKGKKGEMRRKLFNPKIKMEKKDNTIIISAKKATKREKTMIGTFKSHLKNMIKGAEEGHFYKLKICSGHFPMNVTANNNEFIVKNFLGETIPRKLVIKKGVDVKVDGNMVNIDSVDKELAGQTAADIEQLTRITNRDRRIFQDGIWIIEKDGKKVD